MNSTPAETQYPQFYCKAGHCLKRGSDTTTMEIRIPLENDTVPLCYHPVTYPSKARLDEQVSEMNLVNMDTYESYLSDWLKGARKVDQNFTQYRNKKTAVPQLTNYGSTV